MSDDTREIPEAFRVVEHGAAQIRERLLADQPSWVILPTLEQASDMSYAALRIALPVMFESILIPEEWEWMERDHSGESFPELLRQLTPPRPLQFDAEEDSLWKTLETLGGVHISYSFLWEDIAEKEKNDGPVEARNIEVRQDHALQGYEKLCEAFIETQTKPAGELGMLARIFRRMHDLAQEKRIEEMFESLFGPEKPRPTRTRRRPRKPRIAPGESE